MSGLYIHVPFCLSKCPYCDFYSVSDRLELLTDYPRLLTRQLELALESGWRGPFASLFFGGGTPSLLPAAAVAGIIAAVRDRAGLAGDAEISLEANPGTLDAERLEGYLVAGVNRLSLGVQAFCEDGLRQLGRRHTLAEALTGIELARRVGFGNLGIDLMFGRPGQSLADLDAELGSLLACRPEHISAYALTVEAGTPLALQVEAGEVQPADEERVAAGFERIHQQLTAAGYRHYEISNYARPGYECRHNLGYWQRRPYLGLGAGAHSLLPGGRERREVPADLDRFQRELAAGRDPSRLLERLSDREARAETAYLGLRTARGVDDRQFAAEFGCSFAAAFPAPLQKLGDRLQLEQGRWHLGWRDWLLYDHLISPFL